MEAVEFYRDLEFQCVMIEGDALEIDGCCWSRYRQVIDDAKTMINSF
jgi:hypothetical protein